MDGNQPAKFFASISEFIQNSALSFHLSAYS